MQFVPPVITALAGSMTDTTAVKVPGQPPGWIFPIVWTALYTLLGVANLWDNPVYYINLILNAMWTKVYFEDRNKQIAFYIIIGLIVSAVYLAMIRPILWPYVAWLIYAAWLSR
jgi:tryptophan-rich sensory protein